MAGAPIPRAVDSFEGLPELGARVSHSLGWLLIWHAAEVVLELLILLLYLPISRD